ncbi:hypothetical protein VULLAG_LOCUS9503 [Vulpes lagopus]
MVWGSVEVWSVFFRTLGALRHYP